MMHASPVELPSVAPKLENAGRLAMEPLLGSFYQHREMLYSRRAFANAVSRYAAKLATEMSVLGAVARHAAEVNDSDPGSVKNTYTPSKPPQPLLRGVERGGRRGGGRPRGSVAAAGVAAGRPRRQGQPLWQRPGGKVGAATSSPSDRRQGAVWSGDQKGVREGLRRSSAVEPSRE